MALPVLKRIVPVRFVKNMGKDPALCPNGMDVAKLTHKKVLQTLENGVRFGKWVVLENIGEVYEVAQLTVPGLIPTRTEKELLLSSHVLCNHS